MSNLHFNPSTGITTKSVSVPNLKKGDKVTYYSAIFEVLEDSYNCYDNEARLPSERRELKDQTFGAKCKFVSYDDGSGKKGDHLLENYDWFQGNERAIYAVITNTNK